jgi:chemotaxis protein CheD
LLPPTAPSKTPKTSMVHSLQSCELQHAIIETDPTPKVEEVRVDMADMRVESRSVELLTSVGSCVAICVYDTKHKCGGLAHIMLPASSMGPQEPLPSKFADTAVPALAKQIHRVAGKEARLLAKVAGGANMFSNIHSNSLDIGTKNVKAAKSALDKQGIRLVGEDVGGTQGRKVLFNVASGTITVRHHNGEIKKI